MRREAVQASVDGAAAGEWVDVVDRGGTEGGGMVGSLGERVDGEGATAEVEKLSVRREAGGAGPRMGFDRAGFLRRGVSSLRVRRGLWHKIRVCWGRRGRVIGRGALSRGGRSTQIGGRLAATLVFEAFLFFGAPVLKPDLYAPGLHVKLEGEVLAEGSIGFCVYLEDIFEDGLLGARCALAVLDLVRDVGVECAKVSWGIEGWHCLR
jgi:hypothetical protein